MPKSVELTARLIQEVTQSILPAERLDYDSLSYKPLSTLESRVSASAAHSYIWTRIPASLSRLRGFIRSFLRTKFSREQIFGSVFLSDNWALFAQQQYGQNRLAHLAQQRQSPHRGIGGGLLGSIGSIFGRKP